MASSRRESALEAWACRWARSRGYITAKLTLCNGVPDRAFLLPKGRTAMVEFKAQNEEPGKAQAWYIERLRQTGHRVYWCETREEFLAAMEENGCKT